MWDLLPEIVQTRIWEMAAWSQAICLHDFGRVSAAWARWWLRRQTIMYNIREFQSLTWRNISLPASKFIDKHALRGKILLSQLRRDAERVAPDELGPVWCFDDCSAWIDAARTHPVICQYLFVLSDREISRNCFAMVSILGRDYWESYFTFLGSPPQVSAGPLLPITYDMQKPGFKVDGFLISVSGVPEARYTTTWITCACKIFDILCTKQTRKRLYQAVLFQLYVLVPFKNIHDDKFDWARTFVIRLSELFPVTFVAALKTLAAERSPSVALFFAHYLTKDEHLDAFKDHLFYNVAINTLLSHLNSEAQSVLLFRYYLARAPDCFWYRARCMLFPKPGDQTCVDHKTIEQYKADHPWWILAANLGRFDRETMNKVVVHPAN